MADPSAPSLVELALQVAESNAEVVRDGPQSGTPDRTLVQLAAGIATPPLLPQPADAEHVVLAAPSADSADSSSASLVELVQGRRCPPPLPLPHMSVCSRQKRRRAEHSRGFALTKQEAGHRGKIVRQRTVTLQKENNRLVQILAKQPQEDGGSARIVREAVHGVVEAAGGDGGLASRDLRRRVRDSKAIVAAALLHYQSCALRNGIANLPWIVVFWGWDSTPERGRRKQYVQGTSASYVATTSQEHLVQLGSVFHPSLDGMRQEEVITAPVVIPNSSSGAILAALQQAWKDHGLHPLVLSEQARLVIMCMVVDSASSNLKLLKWFRLVFKKNVLCLSLICALHQVMRILKNFSDSLMSSLYSLGKLMTIDTYHAALARNVAGLVKQTLSVFRGVHPPDAVVLRSKRITELCCGISFSQPARFGPREQAVMQDLQMLNGDWRSERVEHYCCGCCESELAAEEKCVRAALRLLMHAKPPLPALNRWGYQMPAVGWWLQGVLCHRLLPRAFEASRERAGVPRDFN